MLCARNTETYSVLTELLFQISRPQLKRQSVLINRHTPVREWQMKPIIRSSPLNPIMRTANLDLRAKLKVFKKGSKKRKKVASRLWPVTKKTWPMQRTPKTKKPKVRRNFQTQLPSSNCGWTVGRKITRKKNIWVTCTWGMSKLLRIRLIRSRRPLGSKTSRRSSRPSSRPRNRTTHCTTMSTC